jgi:hypothetical protein
MKNTLRSLFFLFSILSLPIGLLGQNVIVNGSSNIGLTNYLNANNITYTTNVSNPSALASASHIFWVGSNSYMGTNNALKNFVMNGGVLVISGDCNLSNNIAASQLLNMTFGFNVGFNNLTLPSSSANFCSASGTATINANCANSLTTCSQLEYDSVAFPAITNGLNSLTYNAAANVAGIPGLISVRYKSASSTSLSNKLDIVSFLNYGNGVIIINGDASIFNTSLNDQYFANILSYPPADTTAPVVMTKDITISLDANGQAILNPSQVDSGSSDNRAIATLGVSPSVFDCSMLGSNVVTLTATDAANNSASATAIVTLVDSVAPKAIAKTITVQLDSTGNASIVASDIDDGSFDNCSIASLSVDRNSFNCADLGNPVLVTLTVSDQNGNLNSTTTTVSVFDSNLSDADNDGIKDPCDPDDDNDGILDDSDKYPLDSLNNGQAVILTYVWDDLNGDGIQDPNEPPVAGTEVGLYAKFFKCIGRAVTDSSGQAAFFDLNSHKGVWLRYKRNSGEAFTYSNRGNNNQLDSDVGQIFGFSQRIRISGNQIIDDVDAGIWSPGSIEAYVWNDQNGDGIQDSNEVAIPGVPVKLTGWFNSTIDQVVTDSSGIAHFKNVPAGSLLRLEFMTPPSYGITSINRGNDYNLDSDANPNNGKTSPFFINQGAALVTNVDAGFTVTAAPQASVLARMAEKESDMIIDEALHEVEISLYPNPVQYDFNLKINSTIQEGARLIVFDMMGTRVMDRNITLAQGENYFNFDFSSENLARGQYILSIYPNSQEKKTLKFIKQ